MAQSERFSKTTNENFSSSIFIEIDNLSVVQQNGTVTVPLPLEGEFGDVTFRVKNIEYYSDEDFTWYGIIDSNTNQAARFGEMFLLRKNGEYIGTIQIEDELYSLNDLTGGVAVLGKASSTPQNGICDVTPDTLNENPPVTGGGTCDVRVLVLYTSEAQQQVGNIQNVATSGIAYTNQAFANSALTTKAIKVGIELWPGYSEDGKAYSEILNDLRINGNSPTGFVNGRKVALGADVVVLLVRHSLTDQSDPGKKALGIAYNPANSWSFAYAVSWTSIVDNVVFAHEIAHLFGADHEPCSAVDATNNCSVDEAANFHSHSLNITIPPHWPWSIVLPRKTIVWGNYIQGKHITNFSNPDVQILGTPTGTPTRNNAIRIKNRTCLLAGFNPNEGMLEGYIDAPDSGCEGDLELAEAVVTSASGANVTYEWRKSTNGGISFGGVISTASFVNFTMPPAPGSVVLKLVITGFTGQSITLFKTIISQSNLGPTCRGERSAKHNEKNPVFTVSVAPNPTTDIVHFVISSPDDMEFTLDISDSKGSVILKQEGILRSGANSLQASMTFYPRGVYFYQVTSGGKSVTNSFILNQP